MNKYNPLKTPENTKRDSKIAAIVGHNTKTGEILSVQSFPNLVDAITSLHKCPKGPEVQYDLINNWNLSHDAAAFVRYQQIKAAHEPLPFKNPLAQASAARKLREAAQENISKGKARIAQGSQSLENPLPNAIKNPLKGDLGLQN
jgi:hypothetical protein